MTSQWHDELDPSGCSKPEMAHPPVYVIDDNSDLRKSLHFLLATSKISVWPFAVAEDFLDHLPTLTPGPVLLDMRMPGMDGIQTLNALRERDISWPVIVMTAHGNIAAAVQAMKLGAIDFLEKPFSTDLLDDVLQLAFRSLEKTSAAVVTKATARALLQKLSRRESEVVTFLVEGLPNKTVAHRLGLSTRTVEMHRRNAMGKLGLKSLAETVTLIASAGASSLSGAARG